MREEKESESVNYDLMINMTMMDQKRFFVSQIIKVDGAINENCERPMVLAT